MNASDVTIWFRSNLGALKLCGSDVLPPGEELRGVEFIADGDPPGSDLFYASATVDGVRWRIDVEDPPSVAAEPTVAAPESLPDILPEDIGEATYVRAYGLFRRIDDLNLDDVAPVSDYIERHEVTRAYVAQQLLTIDRSNHFLFGTPGVLADPGRFLYHYTTTDTLRLIAESRSLRLGQFRTKNDPREARPWIGQTVMTRGSRTGQSPTEEDKQRAQRFVREVDDLRLRALMLSFGRDLANDEEEANTWRSIAARGYIQPRMWSQYGDDHKGACIILDRLRIDEAARLLADVGFSRGQEVTYTRELHDLVGVGGYYEAGSNITALDHLIDNADSQLFSKDPDWSNENEYRWICIPDDPDVTEAFIPIDDPRCVLGLVLGDMVEQDGLEAADEFSKTFRIPANSARCSWNNPLHFGAEVHAPLDWQSVKPADESP